MSKLGADLERESGRGGSAIPPPNDSNRPDSRSVIACDCGHEFHVSDLTPPANECGCPHCRTLWVEVEPGVWENRGITLGERMKEREEERAREIKELEDKREARRIARAEVLPTIENWDRAIRALEARRRRVVAAIEELSDLHEEIGDQIEDTNQMFARRRELQAEAKRQAKEERKARKGRK